MNEHLIFKLKKDGQTVGYLRLKDGWTQFHSITFAKDQWYYPCGFKWTTAHPFVTKDKHGKDVFADDYCCIGDPFGGIGSTVSGYVRWSATELTWRIEWDDKRGDTISMLVSQITSIELIEEQEDA